MPGHFIVRAQSTTGDLLVDPFNQGAVLSVDDCADRLRQLYGNSLRFSPELLRPSTPREIVTRILGNLKGCYLRQGDFRRALRAVEWSVQANPDSPEVRRELGILRYRMGDMRWAIAEYERVLEQQPSGPLADQTRKLLSQAAELWTRRN
jgi:regulator of sirC expression with transglutaminase-like and TPR domain